ncbi:NAD(P)/FAD-dependent oxidoreductase [Azospirillum picis]|uniref:NADPH-dependent 2,4-dienoyl-CoA reductase/sulfur reductase-like enzyme n=1 Tax=Azospirillum picis TaxID=488438 RepID=A0ABU0MMA3_9PROT|nr:NAD(P)/FAD-dependent oxidoreductase [Azospirillum picis]MBP2300562.1 NADPH-dependent 2,4-dienoyl-CoA reductase/sulfur reductase-like enzyme [Azospirillum picis]MDQ0534531.1 NADPH-dependent 2,4-dienoyl-CoA reductase/sulfur reductase-like enzyme [Azospirillum picis]
MTAAAASRDIAGPITHAADLADRYDVVVVGAGPAGLSAAVEASGRLAASGGSVLLLDENPSPGGQIYRAVTRRPRRPDDCLGADYWAGLPLADAFAASPAAYAPGATVWGVEPCGAGEGGAGKGHEPPLVGVSLGGAARRIAAGAVILASGAMERPMPVPGWTLPGVMTAGAAQIALKSADAVPAGRIVLAGCGPLLYLLAWQLLRAGAEIAAILDTADPGQRLAALRALPDFLRSPYVAKGLSLLAQVRRRVPVHGGIESLAIEGDGRAEHVLYRQRGRAGNIAAASIDADCVLLHQGVIPSTHLAAAAGCRIEWNAVQRAFQPATDDVGRSSVAGILVAGDGAGIGGAPHAAVAGRIAALAALADLGRLADADCRRALESLRRERARWRRGRAFLDRLYQPAAAFRAPRDPATIVCRCEEVTAGTLRKTVALGVPGPNQLKTFLRCGMGPCQGRLCAQTVTEIMAEERGVDPSAIGTYRLRSPVKPLRLSELAALPVPPDAVSAVTGEPPAKGPSESPADAR